MTNPDTKNLISFKNFKKGDVIHLTQEKLYAIIKDVWNADNRTDQVKLLKTALDLENRPVKYGIDLYRLAYVILDEKGREYPVFAFHKMEKVEDEEKDKFWLRRFANA